MSGAAPQWRQELAAEVGAHRPTLQWLVDHIDDLLGEVDVEQHLLSLGSDLCDAGHIHLDIVLWLLCDDALRTIVVSEEHFDTGPESVDTTFDTTVSVHPFDTIAGTQLSSVSHPDGNPVDIQLAVMMSSHALGGHADPLPYGSDDGPSYAVSLAPTPIVFITGSEQTTAVVAFGHALAAARTTDWE